MIPGYKKTRFSSEVCTNAQGRYHPNSGLPLRQPVESVSDTGGSPAMKPGVEQLNHMDLIWILQYLV
jgi:hypothetical protein